jgi:hypothetical protein
MRIQMQSKKFNEDMTRHSFLRHVYWTDWTGSKYVGSLWYSTLRSKLCPIIYRDEVTHSNIRRRKVGVAKK